MKIDSSHPLARPTQGEASNTSKTAATGNAPAKPGSPAAVTHLSDTGASSGQDIDMARVEEIRQAISEGKLDIRAERIADGLIDSVRNMLGDDSGTPRT
ncbi:anti-sigma-28 factor, FlgM family [Franzmannia pantelleriensis]|uniref:Negative regulator of flagellin synthesis n=1 Tax=Franzmannia pantelleriensis TaxID=48727 RepID=A0A1G9MEM2_9GAMM|nr:flagellar biosynthesis anti-sigma factor FlgM [Halomonas pantelleriensis]SDL72115.1 anti-sigma-28 factor, FlgM family [Halomonas pantelleriensis]